MTIKKTWRWIDRRIDRLNPEVDFPEIVRLSNLYRLSDFVAHWGFAVGSPMAGINPVGMEQVWRGGKSTSASAPQKRVDGSNGHLFSWLEHGADHEITRLSINTVNQYHAHFGKGASSGLGDPEEYVYILCLNATLLHKLQQRLGFSGFNAKEQRAAYLTWSKLAQHFKLATDGSPILDHASFPEDFDGMLYKVDEWLDRPWPYSQSGHGYTTKQIEHFAETWFPRLLRPLGRAMVSSFLAERVLISHGIKKPGLVLRTAAVGLMKFAMFFGTRIAPDPKDSLLDRRRLATSQSREQSSEVDIALHRQLKKTAGGNGAFICPHAPLPQQD